MVLDTKELVLNQYNSSRNLDARIKIHEIYSTNQQDWHHWLFEQKQWKENARIIEFGCGSGAFWKKNSHRISNHWNITLTDISEGMLMDAKTNLLNSLQASYEVMDVQAIPFENESFDTAFAHHMLYHVPDRKKALSEIHRILQPGGKLYASTNGKLHLIEMGELVLEYDSTLTWTSSFLHKQFGLENGEKQLSEHFSNVELKRFNSSLKVTDTKPLVDYILSTMDGLKEELKGERLQEFYSFLESKKEKRGFIFITKDSGLFIAEK